MDPIIYEIIDLFGALLRMLGLAAIGVAAGWLTLEFLRKGQQAWQLQIAVYLGIIGLVVALAYFLPYAPSALGLFGIGLVVAVLVWGMKKPKKDDEEEKTK
ncbi:MAG: hypothetical protein JXB85_17195 [Anaerolineales bacterium]|nr:hypothetical protein [Anaerolineales bacterium]